MRATLALALAGATLVVVAAGGGAANPATPDHGRAGLAARHLEVVHDRPARGLVVFKRRLFFASYDRTGTGGLWRSDGTREGTVLVKKVEPTLSRYDPEGLFRAPDTLYFFVRKSAQTELWKSDGTRSGTARIRRGFHLNTNDYEATVAGDRLFFFGSDSNSNEGLWTSDGTAAGTILVEDRLFAGWDTLDRDNPDEMVAVGNTLFVVADDKVHGKELWRSDGTRRGTRMVKDITPGDELYAYDGPTELTSYDERLFFSADAPGDSRGPRLWRSDGIRGGTVPVMDTSGGAEPAGPRELTVVGETLFFAGSDPSHGRELWRSNGTAAGTRIAVNIGPDADGDSASGSPSQLLGARDRIYFSASERSGQPELWGSEGTAASTVQLTNVDSDGCGRIETCGGAIAVAATQDSVFVSVHGDEVWQNELWFSDGAQSIRRIARSSPMPRWDPAFDGWTAFRGTLFLTGRDAIFTERLMKVADGPPTRPYCHGFPATITGAGMITGTWRDDVIVGSAGADVIDGRGGKDIICAGAGDDVFLQGAEPDGADSMNGEDGVDTVSYAARTSPVRVNLDDTSQPTDGGRDGEYDGTIDVENATGGHAADTLFGDGGDNKLIGGAGNDVFTGQAGDDTELGGEGRDTFSQGLGGAGGDTMEGQAGLDVVTYQYRDKSVRVTIDDGVADDGAAREGDTVRTIEKVVGGSGDDLIIGSTADDLLDGYHGDDRLVGGEGDDTVNGGTGADDLRLRDGVEGNDVGDGGTDTDVATFDPGDVLTNVP